METVFILISQELYNRKKYNQNLDLPYSKWSGKQTYIFYWVIIIHFKATTL